MGLFGNLSLFMATVSFGRWSHNIMEMWDWVNEWVRVTIESRTSPVFDTMTSILFVLEYLCCLTFALGMIGCIISKRKKNFFWNKWFCANYDLFSVPEKSQGIIFFCFCCDTTEYDEHLTIISWWPATNSFKITGTIKTFLVERSNHVYYRYCWIDIAVDV